MAAIKDIVCEDFQFAVEDACLGKNILEITSELTRSAARINRSLTIAAVSCGCISINSEKGMQGRLCPGCRRTLENELTSSLFAACALASQAGISIYDVMLREKRRLSLIGSHIL